MASEAWSADRVAVVAHQLLYRLADLREKGTIPGADELAPALGQPREVVLQASYRLEAQGLVEVVRTMGDPGIMIKDSGVAEVGVLQAHTADVRRRRHAARRALLDWAYASEGTSPPPYLRAFHEDPRAFFFGDPFTDNEVQSAAQYLWESNLLDSKDGLNDRIERIEIGPRGRECVENFDGNLSAYFRSTAKQPASTPGGINVSGTNITIASNSPGAQQGQAPSPSPQSSSDTSSDPVAGVRITANRSLISAVAVAAIGLIGVLVPVWLNRSHDQSPDKTARCRALTKAASEAHDTLIQLQEAVHSGNGQITWVDPNFGSIYASTEQAAKGTAAALSDYSHAGGTLPSSYIFPQDLRTMLNSSLPAFKEAVETRQNASALNNLGLLRSYASDAYDVSQFSCSQS